MPTNPPLLRRLLPHLLVLFLYGLGSLAVTWPLVLQFGSVTLGPYYADRMQNEWNLWWTGTALLDRHISPFATDMLFYPQGADLYFHTLNLPLVLLALPIARVFGLTAGYNSSVILALVLAAYAGFRLARFVTGHAAPAFIGGLIIGFNPLSLALVQGQVNALDLAPCVLCIEFYLRSWRSGRRRDMILTGLFFALAVLTVGYYEGYLLLFFALHLLWLAWSVWRARRESQPVLAGLVAPRQVQQAAPLQPASAESPIAGPAAPQQAQQAAPLQPDPNTQHATRNTLYFTVTVVLSLRPQTSGR
jgi:hypothetical protein